MVVFFKVCAHSTGYTMRKIHGNIIYYLKNGEVKSYEISVFDEKNV